MPKSKAWSHWGSLHLRKLFTLLGIDCVLDVGANTGQYRDFLRNEVGYDGLVISFEPNPEHVVTLRQRASSDENWLIEAYALGSSPGEFVLNVTAHSVFSSFLEPNEDRREIDPGMNIARQVRVPVRTLDDVVPDIESRVGRRRMYLKLDTQGYDLEVAKGASQALKIILALQTEASVVPNYLGMPDYVAAIREFESFGFVLSGIFPNHGESFPRLIEFDAVMLRPSNEHPRVTG